jgi:Mn2+/Fe2+ NRAMP family transporter
MTEAGSRLATYTQQIEGADAPVRVRPGSSRLGRIFTSLGPGLITGASDDDPSRIGTYLVAGAALGYATLLTVPVSFPMMAAVQFTCAKIGMVSGTGLGAVLGRRFPRPLV